MKNLIISFLFHLISVSYWCQNNTPYHFVKISGTSAQLYFDLEQDNEGRMLLATEKGLLAYNGYSIANVPAQGAVSKEIIQLVRHEKRMFAINRSNQFFERIGGVLKEIKLLNLKHDIQYLEIINEELYVVGNKEYSVFSLPTLQLKYHENILFTEQDGVKINAIYPTKEETFAVLNSGELVANVDGSARSIPATTGRFLTYEKGKLYIIPSYTSSEFLFSYKEGLFRPLNKLEAKSKLKVNQLDKINGIYYISTDNGLYVFKNGLKKEPQLWYKSIPITAVHQDEFKNLWIATKGKGVLFQPSGKQLFINTDDVNSIAHFEDNYLWATDLTGQIHGYVTNGKSFNLFNNPFQLNETRIVYADRKNNLMFTTSGAINLQNKEIVSSIQYRSVAEAGKLGIFYSTLDGVYWSNVKPKIKQNWKKWALKSKLIYKESARLLSWGPIEKKLIIASQNSVYAYKPGAIEVEEVLDRGKKINAQQLIWQNDVLYILTAQNEILKIRHGEILDRRKLNASSDELNVQQFYTYKNGFILLTEKSIFKIADLQANIENIRDQLGFDGINFRDISVINDDLFIATQRGIIRFKWEDSSNKKEIRAKLIVQQPIGKLSQFDVLESGIQSFKPQDKWIKIPIECIDLTGGMNTIISYTIENDGEIGEWNSLPVSAKELNLAYLEPGTYKVKFALVDPVTNDKTAVEMEEFHIQYSWYNSPLFRVFALVVLGLLFFVFWKYSLKKQKRFYQRELKMFEGPKDNDGIL